MACLVKPLFRSKNPKFLSLISYLQDRQIKDKQVLPFVRTNIKFPCHHNNVRKFSLHFFKCYDLKNLFFQENCPSFLNLDTDCRVTVLHKCAQFQYSGICFFWCAVCLQGFHRIHKISYSLCDAYLNYFPFLRPKECLVRSQSRKLLNTI